MGMPKVAAVTINWNQASSTIECIRALQKSEHADLDIIVIDNGSVDQSVRLIGEKCPGVPVIQNRQNLGFAGGCNRGIEEALGKACDFVFLLNNDAVAAPDTISILVRHMQEQPEVGICAPMIMWHDRPEIIQMVGARMNRMTGIFRAAGMNEKDMGQYKLPIEFDMVSGCALMVRRDLFEKVGEFDEDFFCYLEEADFCFRARKAGYKITTVPQAKVFHKNALSSGGSSSPSRIYYSVRNHLRFLDKNVPPRNLLHNYVRKLAVLTSYMAFVALRSDVPTVKGVRACFEGYKDYLRGRFGPLS